MLYRGPQHAREHHQGVIPEGGGLAGRGGSSPRDRLLDTAGKLFQGYGSQAVGIDWILAESGREDDPVPVLPFQG